MRRAAARLRLRRQRRQRALLPASRRRAFGASIQRDMPGGGGRMMAARGASRMPGAARGAADAMRMARRRKSAAGRRTELAAKINACPSACANAQATRRKQSTALGGPATCAALLQRYTPGAGNVGGERRRGVANGIGRYRRAAYWRGAAMRHLAARSASRLRGAASAARRIYLAAGWRAPVACVGKTSRRR